MKAHVVERPRRSGCRYVLRKKAAVPVTGTFERAVRDNAADVGDGEEQRPKCFIFFWELL
jgi:hypothetical protein